jgi:hypothetical protein
MIVLTVGIRRYGFQGLAHEAMWRRWLELEPGLERGGKLITLQRRTRRGHGGGPGSGSGWG